MKFPDDSHPVPEVFLLSLQTEGPHVPAFAEEEGQGVLPLLQVFCSKCDDLNIVFIRSAAGKQILVSQLLPVHIGFEKADTGRIETGPLHGTVHGKSL